ncbi:PREDICTED: uncharacterized protein LOC103326305 [Prunus mume]|uniref:Uncharacterized protein LOC103326305 n=1 Tax=Prunus mume TaxID=102107 RepID=A0ABM0NLX5_PRUMU|nr:PREDICTED: uncharacterized protein LOC103326305 [Prunus mume]
MEIFTMLFVFTSLLFSILSISNTKDIITPSVSIRYGETLVSSGGSFQLGFFRPGNSSNQYLGIWYNEISPQTIVWVANRENPLTHLSAGALNITDQGALVLLSDTNRNSIVWSSNTSRKFIRKPVAQLQESGNLVVKDGNELVWQSFDYPTDNLLPGMKLGWNLKTGLNKVLSSWKDADDPAPGEFSFSIDRSGYPQLVVKKGPRAQYRLGSWNGLGFTGSPELGSGNELFKFDFVSNESEVSYRFELLKDALHSRLLLNLSGGLQRFMWVDKSQSNNIIYSAPVDRCDTYDLCGAYAFSLCKLGADPKCSCLQGFEPKSPRYQNSKNASLGCVPKTPLGCSNGDGFQNFTRAKLPDTSSSWINSTMSLEECKKMCLRNCSCTAYANLDISEGGSGCLLWFGDLIDIKEFDSGGQDLFVRTALLGLDDIKTSKPSGVKKKVAIIASVGLLGMGMIILGLVFYKRKKKLKAQGKMKNIREKNFDFEFGNEDLELITFDLATVSRATDNFSNNNKLGEGGFGPVYKGILIEGQDIAVKRLSKCSGQGIKEFMNEVILIAKLQHRNLVKLLGCCIEGDEKMLIYEYMPNKSLDYFIFDDTRSKFLGWDQRINIIGGIARGLLYLHQDSRLRIIHRDLKTSNVLLDKDMNPKISDFGTARAFGADQTEENTNRVVGTYGYMSPEYVVDGIFSIKSDVYSFGVMVLEIVSGKKNRGFYHPDHQLNLLGHAWTLWIEGRPLEVLDEVLDGSCPLPDVSRCIHIALLCVQQQPEDRPNMASVVLMLGGEGSLPAPKQPGFFTDRNPVEADSSSINRESHSINEMTVTLLEARMGGLCFLLISTNLLFLFFTISSAVDSISLSQSISDNTTLVSSDGSFELGFFSPGSSTNRYLGIWYKNMNIPGRTVVWVANRCNPINDSSGMLMINSTGNLVLFGQNKSVVWSTSSVKRVENAMVQLLDSGNLVVRDAKDGISGPYLWQSFDYPSDTLLPGMKLGWDLRTGLKRHISAWKNSEDPCPGNFTYGIEMERQAYPEAYIRNGTAKIYRASPFNGLTFCGSSEKHPARYGFSFVYNDDEVYYMYKPTIKSITSRIVLNQTTSSCIRFHWKKEDEAWTAHLSRPRDVCDHYGFCGANGNCIGENPVCQCLKGFKPKSQEKWNLADWSLGCVRNKPLSCQKTDKDGFLKLVGLKLPDTTHSWVNKSMNLKECRAECLNNCSCMAYRSSDIRGGTGCAIWFGDLIDTTQALTSGQEIYIRMSASELEENDGKLKTALIVVAVIAVVFSGVLLVAYYIHRRRKKLKEIRDRNQDNEGAPKEDLELPLFELATVISATDNFSSNNKLGEGGFGPVYKGTLADGQEIAVKRLSRSSGQGMNEFMTEVILIAKLQHRNLVKLLGCCVQGDEKMLIYEYMPNGSLDSFIFDQTSGELLLDWPKRYHIICGIARGLLYLHQDSRLRIIHRDLKVSNVLLDNEMNPKISDFGLARTLTGGNQTGGNTNRVVGTYGYMAPEYVVDGQFSVKSDVFSFGVLVLEVISGRKNKGFYHPTSPNLIGHAWRLWNEGRHLELIDTYLGSASTLSEMSRCIHVSLLCVQHHPEDRPSMASVVIMLGSEMALAQPKQPGFFMEKESHEAGHSSEKQSSSANELSITVLEAR